MSLNLSLNLKTESVVIDGVKFETTQFPAMRAYGLLTKLVKAVGPALGLLASASAEARIEDMAPAIGASLGNLTPSEAQGLLLEILQSTTAEDAGVVQGLTTEKAINVVFSGKLPDMFKVMAHALKVNYANFFDGSAADPAETSAQLPDQASK